MVEVILVDENDCQIGTEEKHAAHQNGGKLHRAFSILVFNDRGKLLLQQRAKDKYHGGCLWANTCCGHPVPGEDTKKGAERRLSEEMGFSVELSEIGSFTYKHDIDKGMTEHEFDHVFMGKHSKDPCPDAKEVNDWKWIGLDALQKEMEKSPGQYAPWFKTLLKKIDIKTAFDKFDR